MVTNKTCKIFLASSIDEMQQQRLEFGDFIRKLSDIYRPRGVDITVTKCEDLHLAYNGRPTEEELHDEVRSSDVLVTLFYKQCGKWTVQEFDVACKSMAANKKPKIIVAVQNAETREPELESFIKKVDEDKGIFHWRFDTKEKLHFDFVMWFLQSEFAVGDTVTVEAGAVKVGDLTVAQFSQLPFAANNTEYQQLEERLKSLNEDIEQIRLSIKADPDNTMFSEWLSKKVMERDEIQKKLEIQQDALLGAARKIAEMRKQQVSKKLQEAIDAFEAGQLEKANKILEGLKKEGEQLMAEVETKLEQIHEHIDALQLQSKTVMADVSIPIGERIARVAEIYAKADDWAIRSAYDKKKYAKLLFDYADFQDDYAHYDEAEKIYLRQIALSEELYGKDSTDTATSYNNIGLVYKNQGDYAHALEYEFKALAIYEKVLGTEHPSTATSYNNIGAVYDDKGDYAQALEYYFKALAIREKVLGTEPPDTATSYNNIGAVYDEHGDYDKALEYYFKALEIDEKVLGTEHPNTATDYNNIGLLYKKQGDYAKALEYYFKALAICEKVFGTEHPSTATSYNNIGGVYYKQGDYVQALEYYFKALEIDEKVLGTEHPDTATDYNNIGSVYDEQDGYDKALEYYFKALDIFRKVLGEDHPYTAITYGNIGVVYFKQGDIDKALEYIMKAKEIKRKRSGGGAG